MGTAGTSQICPRHPPVQLSICIDSGLLGRLSGCHTHQQNPDLTSSGNVLWPSGQSQVFEMIIKFRKQNT